MDTGIERTTNEAERRARRRGWARSAIGLLSAVLVVLTCRAAVADHYVVPTGSMRPTVRIGDRILVDKLAYGLRVPLSSLYLCEGADPQRGDVVVFSSPEDGEVLLTKRAEAGSSKGARMHTMTRSAPAPRRRCGTSPNRAQDAPPAAGWPFPRVARPQPADLPVRTVRARQFHDRPGTLLLIDERRAAQLYEAGRRIRSPACAHLGLLHALAQ